MKAYSMVMVSVGGADEAEQIASALVDRKLAACVQEFPITSTYVWEGKVNRDAEILLLIKSRREHFSEIEACVKELHSYDVAEIVQFEIVNGASDYLKWITETTER